MYCSNIMGLSLCTTWIMLRKILASCRCCICYHMSASIIHILIPALLYLILVSKRGPQVASLSLQWRHNGRDSASNHQPCECLLSRSIRRRSKRTSKLCVTGLCVVNSPGPGNSPHKWPVTWKMFPLDDVIMISVKWLKTSSCNELLSNILL